MTVSTSLTRLNNGLAKLQKGAGRLTSKELEAIGELMSREDIAHQTWLQFDEALLKNSSDVFCASPVDQFFSRAALIEDHLHTAFYNAVPGVLTGIGLLMTFVAILDGLSHVSVTANMDVQGIGGLINGLSGKFVSSIVAVTCAVCFVFVERFAYSQPQDAYRKLVTRLSSRFRRRTAEHMLHEIEVKLSTVLGELAERRK